MSNIGNGDRKPIGVFDSGFGGLTALRRLRELAPNENLIYFGDTGRMPYGGRSSEELHTIGRQDIEFLLDFDVKLILAACGTVSTVALNTLIPNYTVPIFGVIHPAALQAAQITRTGHICVIATEATIGGGSFQRALAELNPELRVSALACPKLVPLVESGRFRPSDPGVMETLFEYLDRFRGGDMDTLLLGCTHYPLMGGAIRAFLGVEVNIVGSGEAAAEALVATLAETGQATSVQSPGKCTYYTSGSALNFSQTAELILGESLGGEVLETEPFPLDN